MSCSKQIYDSLLANVPCAKDIGYISANGSFIMDGPAEVDRLIYLPAGHVIKSPEPKQHSDTAKNIIIVVLALAFVLTLVMKKR